MKKLLLSLVIFYFSSISTTKTTLPECKTVLYGTIPQYAIICKTTDNCPHKEECGIPKTGGDQMFCLDKDGNIQKYSTTTVQLNF